MGTAVRFALILIGASVVLTVMLLRSGDPLQPVRIGPPLAPVSVTPTVSVPVTLPVRQLPLPPRAPVPSTPVPTRWPGQHYGETLV